MSVTAASTPVFTESPAGARPGPSVDPPDRTAQALRALAGVGLTLAFVGWIDVGLNLYPARIGNPDWEFGTAGAVFDSLPLGTLGLGLLLVAAHLGARPWALRALGAVLLSLAGLLLAMLGLYALALPEVWRAADARLHEPLSIAVGKTVAVAALYLVLYVWLAVGSWRSARPGRRSAGR